MSTKMEKYLIIVDMQKDFINGSLGSKEAEKIVPNVVEKIKNFSGTVLYTMDTHYNNYMETEEGKNLPVIHCIKETDGWELNTDVKKAIEEKIGMEFVKDTFGSKELGRYLGDKAEEEEIETITLIGLCTDICVISNALLIKAFVPNIPIHIDSSCCAGVTAESHKQALEAMKVCQIQID